MCSVSSICWEYSEFCLFHFIAWTCSVYQSLDVRPVCPTYLCGHSLHFKWCAPL
jgi:hypothetical protein